MSFIIGTPHVGGDEEVFFISIAIQFSNEMEIAK